MSGISDDSLNPDAAVLAAVRLLQERLAAAPMNGGEIDELLRSCLELLRAYVSETRPALTHVLDRAQEALLPREMLDELMAAAAKIDADRMSTVRGMVALDEAGGNRKEILRRTIAGIEHMNDGARALTKRIDRLIEEFESERSDRG
jgi:hypothetical protein